MFRRYNGEIYHISNGGMNMAKKKLYSFEPIKKEKIVKDMYAIIFDGDNGVEYITIGNKPEVFETEAEAYSRVGELNRKEKEMFGNITSKYQIIPYTVEGVI